MGPIRLEIAEERALPCKTMKTVLDGELDMRVDASATEASLRSRDVRGVEA